MNWFTSLYEFNKVDKKEDFPSHELLRPFQEFLGATWPECLVITCLGINYKKRAGQAIVQLFEKLIGVATQEQIIEALIDLIAVGWIQIGSDDYSESRYELTFTHKVEVALRNGDNSIFKQKLSSQKRKDRSILGMYAHAILFKSKITDLDAWVDIADLYLEISEHELAQTIRKARLDRFTQSVVLFIYLMHIVEGSHSGWRILSQLFTENRMAARRTLYNWKNTNWKPLRIGLLEVRQYPVGPAIVCPPELLERKIFGFVGDIKQEETQLPSSLQHVPARSIPNKKLMYNPKEGRQIELLSKMLKPAAFKKFQKTADKFGQKPGISVLLSGGPGTGKTELARQLSRATGRDLLMFNVAEARDKYFGESEKRIKEVFECYKELMQKTNRVPILFFNEGDSVFQKRHFSDTGTGSTENTIQTILLNELEVFEGILICTTNRSESFDAAFNRRFLLQISIHPPTEPVRIQMLTHLFKEMGESQIKYLAGQFEFTAAELENFRKLYYMETIAGSAISDMGAMLEDYLQTKFSIKNKIGFRFGPHH